MKNIALSLLLIFISCENKTNSVKSEDATVYEQEIKDNSSEINYFEFKPDIITNVKIDGFDMRTSFELNGKKIITGNYTAVDGKLSAQDLETDYGFRLLVLNKNNEIVFKSLGAQDAFLLQPHFYKNKENGKVIIICQLAFEYFYGGDAYVIDNKMIKYIGNLDLESTSEESGLVDIVKVSEKEKQLFFKFKSDSILLHPGSKDLKVKNTNSRYVYENGTLRFVR